MLLQFNVVAFVQGGREVGVVGSHPAIGGWDPRKAVPLRPYRGGTLGFTSASTVIPKSANTSGREITDTCPTYFCGFVELPDVQYVPQQAFEPGTMPQDVRFTTTLTAPIQYKYITWTRQQRPTAARETERFPLPPLPGATHLTPDGFLYTSAELSLQDPEIEPAEGGAPGDLETSKIQWEGRGPSDNRYLYVIAGDFGPPEGDDSLDLRHVMRGQHLVIGKSRTYYALPPTDFIAPSVNLADQRSELTHTTHYYNHVKELQTIHFNYILPRLYAGSCPRRPEHLDKLRDVYGVGAVFNFQSLEDLRNNWINSNDPMHDRNPMTLHSIYSQKEVQLIHIPTTDMCSEARAAMMAQAAWLLAGFLVANPDRNVYVHCNAGVGRAVACCCAFLHFALGVPEEQAKLLMRRQRPVAFIDPCAIRSGKEDFDKKYAKATLCLPLVDFK